VTPKGTSDEITIAVSVVELEADQAAASLRVALDAAKNSASTGAMSAAA
jgi:hypothetical protein